MEAMPIFMKLFMKRDELNALKKKGNEAFKSGDFTSAFNFYSEGIDMLKREFGIDNMYHAQSVSTIKIGVSTQDDVAGIPPTLYANRAAAGLKLQAYEQVVYDCTRAISMMSSQSPGGTPGRLVNVSLRPTCGKAFIRRGEALLALGVLSAAQHDFTCGCHYLNLSGDNVNHRKAFQLGNALTYPTQYGKLGIPSKPVPRSTVHSFAQVETIKTAKVPDTCLFSSSAVYNGKLYMYGGKISDPTEFNIRGDTLYCFNPADGKFTELNVASDIKAPAKCRKPGGRSSAAMVVWRDALYLWGGDVPGLQYDQDTLDKVSKAIWRVDLTKSTLKWERLWISGECPSARYDFAYAVYKDQFLVFGGHQMRYHEIADTWSFDFIKNKWTMISPDRSGEITGQGPLLFPEARSYSAGWVWEDYFYIFSGYATDQSPGKTKVDLIGYSFSELWRLNLITKKWEMVHGKGAVPVGRGEVGVAVSDKGNVYIVGGYSAALITVWPHGPDGKSTETASDTSYLNEVLEFSPATEQWRSIRTADMQGPIGRERAGCSAAFIDGALYCIGGYIGFNECKPFKEVIKISLKACAVCGQGKEATGKLYQCSGCKERGAAPTYYCSADHQRKDWPAHSCLCAEDGLKL